MKHNLRFYSLVLIITLLPIAIVATSQVMTYRPSAYYPTPTPTPSFYQEFNDIILTVFSKNGGSGPWISYNLACDSRLGMRVTVEPARVETRDVVKNSPIYADFKVLNSTNPRQSLPTQRATLTKKIIDSVTGKYVYQAETFWSNTVPNLNKGTNWTAQAMIKVNVGTIRNPLYDTAGASMKARFGVEKDIYACSR